jgi:hypothetical protein
VLAPRHRLVAHVATSKCCNGVTAGTHLPVHLASCQSQCQPDSSGAALHEARCRASGTVDPPLASGRVDRRRLSKPTLPLERPGWRRSRNNVARSMQAERIIGEAENQHPGQCSLRVAEAARHARGPRHHGSRRPEAAATSVNDQSNKDAVTRSNFAEPVPSTPWPNAGPTGGADCPLHGGVGGSRKCSCNGGVLTNEPLSSAPSWPAAAHLQPTLLPAAEPNCVARDSQNVLLCGGHTTGAGELVTAQHKSRCVAHAAPMAGGRKWVGAKRTELIIAKACQRLRPPVFHAACLDCSCSTSELCWRARNLERHVATGLLHLRLASCMQPVAFAPLLWQHQLS